ncbi:hypothetical protein J2W98_002472 [Paenibacillus peoriae]|uniref:Uncharacterized protein n=1 Tax=Paenibacillus peoriae TaxID=59893 RepID=A0ABU1QF16_9BACL|nr:hypothetical protein [Paenibacillus peoriae]
MTHDEIHLSFMEQGFCAAVIRYQHHAARVETHFRAGSDRLGHIMPCGALPHLGIHAESDTLGYILGRDTLVVARNSRGCIDRQTPIIGGPCKMAIRHLARAQRGLNFPDHHIVSIDDTREIHDFAQPDHIRAPA